MQSQLGSSGPVGDSGAGSWTSATAPTDTRESALSTRHARDGLFFDHNLHAAAHRGKDSRCAMCVPWTEINVEVRRRHHQALPRLQHNDHQNSSRNLLDQTPATRSQLIATGPTTLPTTTADSRRRLRSHMLTCKNIRGRTSVFEPSTRSRNVLSCRYQKNAKFNETLKRLSTAS